MDYYCISLNDLNYGEVLDKYNRRKEKMQLVNYKNLKLLNLINLNVKPNCVFNSFLIPKDDLIADYQDLFVYELHENAFFNRFSIEIRVSDRSKINSYFHQNFIILIFILRLILFILNFFFRADL